MMTRMTLFIALSIYLILAGLVITATLAYFGNEEVLYNVATQDIRDNTLGSFATGLVLPYFWVGLLLVGIPFIIWLIIGITLFFPTGNAGA